MIGSGKRRKSIVGAACASYALGRQVISPKEFIERSWQMLPANPIAGYLINHDPPIGWKIERLDKHG